MKHVGKMKNNAARIVVAYRTLPGDPHSCLVVGTSGLGDSYHDTLMSVVESDSGQQSNELADILSVRRFPDGSNMLGYLHANGHLIKVKTSLVSMTPDSKTTLALDEMNRITKNIPEEAKIADELQEMKEETGEASIIRWTLENQPEKLKEWCFIDENNELQGPLAKRFEQAIRLEGTKSNQSKHAAGIAISAYPLNSLCPMVYDSKNNQLIAGMEMQDLESLGIIKFDILGIALLDKIMCIQQLLLTNGE